MYSHSLINVLKEFNNKTSEDITIFDSEGGGYRLLFPEQIGLFSESENQHKKFFDEIWKYYLEGHSYWFMEKQYTAKVTKSGIMFDFDIILSSDKSVMAANTVSDLIRELAQIIYKLADIPESTETTVFYMANSAVKPYKGESFKEGFHILFPGIQVSAELKTAILVSAMEMATEFFEDEKDILDKSGVLDKNSASVPVQLYGTIRKEKTEHHKVRSVFKVKMANKIKITDITSNYAYVRKNGKIPYKFKTNIILETSIIYAGGLVVKKSYESRISAMENIVNNNNIFAKDVENSMEISKKQMLNLIQIDHRARELNAYLECINWQSIKENNEYGRVFGKIAKNILLVDIKYAPFVRVLSNSLGKINVNKLIEDVGVILNRSTETRATTAAKNLGALKKLARDHNPVRFEQAKKNTMVGAIDSMLASQSVVTDNKIATVVQDMLKDCFYCVHVKKPGFSTNVTSYWMEYVILDQSELPNDMKPFLYKWYRHDSFPKSIDRIITKDIADVFESVLGLYNAKKEKNNEESKGLDEAIKVLKSIIKKCGDANGIENIKKRCVMLMENTAQQSELDQDPTLLGVYNGVLKFDKTTVRLLTEEGRNAVSQSTGCGFIQYSPECKTTRKIMNILEGTMPEKAKLEGLLMHFSMCLVGGSCKRYFTMLYSKGSSGKSIWMFLMQTALGLRGSAGQNSGFGYYDTVDASAFMMDKMDVNGVDHHLMKLGGARFIHLPEGKHKGEIQTHIIKKLREPFGVRGMYESLRPTIFTGIISMLTNSDKIGFSDYNYALFRRFLYVTFPITFKPRSELREETDKVKFMDESVEEKVKKRKYGEAFFSILVYYWCRLKTYSDAAQMYTDTGLLQETINFMGERNMIEKFVQTRLAKNIDAAPIELNELCTEYIEWARQLNGTIINLKTARDDLEEIFPNDIVEGKLSGFEFVNL
jgi:hypothetical protein